MNKKAGAGESAGEKGITAVQREKDRRWEDYRTVWNGHHKQGDSLQLGKLNQKRNVKKTNTEEC